MQRASAGLVGRRDFAAFATQLAREPAGRTTVRTVLAASWHERNGVLDLTITADAFLRHMVRGIVGTLVRVGRGNVNLEQLNEIVLSADRRRAGDNAPAHGLTLCGVAYPAELGGPSGELTD